MEREPFGDIVEEWLKKGGYSTGQYSNNFATLDCDSFFDFDTVHSDDVGCLSQFFIKEGYRNKGIGTDLFNMSMDWLNSFQSIRDIFNFVSNGNDDALKFYLSKGFKISH
ncbi:GNAT superfamily N-acetyltransferase [Caldalkalibacillus uzonensis]|uniref:GNAT superfamily N-acetyltransferase n=1 Tax=Caldalkalibacillus uzonensis TaxID=353224 RepID=A0ABU0CXB0_9BACI|nr:GNAT family N-acetyltransferase [Caldalkalibacillus uzonensis]MDQ0340917.1 GNAT superfamily N-acetyltransferase [Caldalkalibacillus uzonensis]